MQGFLFCRPLPARELREVISAPIHFDAAARKIIHPRPAMTRPRKAAS
jgi:hypothetical protein